MSLVVSTRGPDDGMEAARTRRLRWRVSSVVASMLVVGGLAAVPLPIWRAKDDLAWRADELRAWIAATMEQERELAAWQDRRGLRTLEVAAKSM